MANEVGTLVTQHLEGNIVETVYRGRIVFDGSLNRDLERFLRTHPGMDWLVDATEATGIDPRRRDNAGDTIGMFRTLGGRAIAAVVPATPVRMVASAMAFGFDLPMKIFANRDDALAYLRQLDRPSLSDR